MPKDKQTNSKQARAAERESNRATIAWVLSVAGGSLGGAFAILAIEMLTGASAGLQALLSRNVIDCAAAQDFNGIVYNAIGLAALIGAVMVLTAVNAYLKERLDSTLENHFKHRIIDTILSGDYAAVRTLHSGDLMNRITTDTVQVAAMLTKAIPTFGGIMARLLAAAVVLFSFDAVLGTFVLLAGIIVLVPSTLKRKKFKQMHKAIQEAHGKMRMFVLERLNSLLVIHSFAKEEETLRETDHLMDEHRTARLKRTNAVSVFSLVRGFLTKGAYAIAALWCVYGIYTGSMSYGTLVATLQLVTQMQSPLSTIAGFIPGLYAALASAERLREVEALAHKHDAFLQQDMPDLGGFTAIGFDGVEFSYEHVEQQAQERFEEAQRLGGADADADTDADEGKEGQPDARKTIRNISLRVPHGSYVAFAGPSGTGKSTALKLFMCLYPVQGGTRYYEDAQGRRELESCARWLFAYVPQGNMLLSGTIREAVSFGAAAGGPEPNDERLWEALRIACADEFVRKLDLGLDTKLKERGGGLSEGQMQRISIARAIFSDRPVILLDEATSALDEQTEARLLANLQQMTDKTVLVVTHRPAALAIVDTIVQFSEDGIVVEDTKRYSPWPADRKTPPQAL